MIETPLEPIAIFAGGLLGAGHCVGMCGGFVAVLGAAGRSWKLNLTRQLLYGLGRVFTYSFGGMAAAAAGDRLSQSLPDAVNLQAWLCLLAGALLIWQGLHALGWLRPFVKSSDPCLGAGMLGDLLRANRLQSVFLGGMINGFLPCGLVYAYLALAGSTRQPLQGGLVMLLFGLGTIPVLALLGLGVGRISLMSRRRVLTIAAVLVLVTGLFSLWRGWQFLQAPTDSSPACPLCAEESPALQP